MGSAFVGILEAIARLEQPPFISLWSFVPGVLLIAGLFAGALAPDSGYSPQGDVHPWGPISELIVYVVNIGIYSGLAYLILHLVHRRLRSISK